MCIDITPPFPREGIILLCDIFKMTCLIPILCSLYRLAKKGVDYDNLFEEVPVMIKNSNLMTTCLSEIEEMANLPDKDAFLSLATG